MQFKCPCGQVVKLTKDNTVIKVYATPKYDGRCPFNHALVSCPGGHPIRYFTDEADIKKLGSMHCRRVRKQYPEDDVIKGFNQVFEVKAPKTYQLTPRLEAMVGKFGIIIQKMPPKLLYQLLTDPQPSRLPKRWIV